VIFEKSFISGSASFYAAGSLMENTLVFGEEKAVSVFVKGWIHHFRLAVGLSPSSGVCLFTTLSTSSAHSS